MILCLDCKGTQELFESERNRRFSNIGRVALRKLIAANAAERLGDLVVPPGNELKPWKDAGEAGMRFGSMTSGELSFVGRTRVRPALLSRATIESPITI